MRPTNCLKLALTALSVCALILATDCSFGEIITLDSPGANYIYQYSKNSDGTVGGFTYLVPSSSGTFTYGFPAASGHSLTFNQLNGMYFASLATKSSSQFVDGSLGVDIIARPGTGLTSFALLENGSYSFGDNADAGTNVKAKFLSARVTIEAVNGLPVSYAPVDVVMAFTATSYTTAYSGASNNTITIPGATAGDAGTWTGTLAVNLLGSEFPHVTGAITKVGLYFDNTLESNASSANYAMIDKKAIVLQTTGVNVPEPGTLIMLAAAGLLGFAIWHRKN